MDIDKAIEQLQEQVLPHGAVASIKAVAAAVEALKFMRRMRESNMMTIDINTVADIVETATDHDISLEYCHGNCDCGEEIECSDARRRVCILEWLRKKQAGLV